MIRAAPVSGLLFFCFSKSSQKGIKKSILTTFFFFEKGHWKKVCLPFWLPPNVFLCLFVFFYAHAMDVAMQEKSPEFLFYQRGRFLLVEGYLEKLWRQIWRHFIVFSCLFMLFYVCGMDFATHEKSPQSLINQGISGFFHGIGTQKSTTAEVLGRLLPWFWLESCLPAVS